MTLVAEAPLQLGSRRLRLREFEPADRHALVAMHRDPRVREALLDDWPLDRHVVAAQFIERLHEMRRREPGLGIWCAERVDRTADDRTLYRFAGWFSLMRMPGRGGAVEFGCRLLPQTWGSGLVLDGGELLLDHALHRLALPELWAVCHPTQRSVPYCLHALGFDDEGHAPYEGLAARWFRLPMTRWRTWRERPRRERVRAAVAAQHALCTARATRG